MINIKQVPGLEKKQLGVHGPNITPLGLGVMCMSGDYNNGVRDDKKSAEVLNSALDLGVQMLDTSDLYGRGHNEQLISAAVGSRYKDAFLATKFGFVYDEVQKNVSVSGKPEYVRACCDASLQRLKADCIDLYYTHRTDPNTPIEDTVEAMADLVKQGKVKHIGLSEASPNTIRRAAAVHPITAVQSEYSIFSREIEEEVLPTCREVGAALVAYCPLGRGLLTGGLRSFSETDMRVRSSERFIGDHLDKNLELVQRIVELANAREATAAQLALAWLLAQGEDIFPIFGTTRMENLTANLAALDIQLSAGELTELSALSKQVSGTRYHQSIEEMSLIDTPERASI